MPTSRPIGFFDSGIGGISILKAVKKLLPNESTVFIADQKNIPFGTKPIAQINNITKCLTDFLMSHDIKLLVVACNTATCFSIDYLRRSFSIPIIGVVPAVKPAAKLTKKSKIAVMSTKGTYKSKYLEKLIEDHAKKIEVLKLDCNGLESAIEKLNDKEIDALLNKYSKPIIKFGADVVVLGCTHYPLIKEKIANILGEEISILDSGEAIAKRVKVILDNLDLSSTNSEEIYYTTGNPKEFSLALSKVLERNISAKYANI